MAGVLGSPVLETEPLSPPSKQKSKKFAMREFGDAAAARQAIFDDALEAASNMEPVENARHILRLTDVHYDGPDKYRLKDEKQALLTGETLDRKLRGTWQLIDKATGRVLDKSKQTVAHIPWMTPRGTFVHNGSDMALVNQQRLRAGVYARIKENGDIECHANILPGKGPSHRYHLDPEKGVYYLNVQQAKIPLMPLLRALGAKDKQLLDAWGPKLYQANLPMDNPQALNKMIHKLVSRIEPGADDAVKRAALRTVFDKMELDPQVSQRTLGQPYKHMGLDTVLDVTKKLLAISRGEAEVDDRDHMANQTVHGPEDLISERLARDYGGVRRKLLMRASFAGNLQRMPVNALNKQVETALLHSGLGQNLEEVNPADVLDKQARITRLGVGGIPSLDSVPDEARGLQPSHFSFIDPLRTPESLKVGVDTQIARGARKGNDGKIYSQFVNPQTGKTVFRSPEDVADLAVAFPGEMEVAGKRARVIQSGRMRYVLKSKVDLVLPSMEHGMSYLSNLIPMKMMAKGQRVAMGSRMLTQAVPVTDPEAPWIQSGVPESPGHSFEEEYGKHMGALRYGGGGPGRVLAVDADGITVQGADGKKETLDLCNNFPFNRKTFVHQTPLVQPGDQIKPGQLLAHSNYTDKQGTTALGKNAYMAYMPFKGLNTKDAVVISEDFAKRMSSEHAYQHAMVYGDDHKPGKRAFLALFPGKFNRQQIETLDDQGVARAGTVLHHGDPIVVAAKQRAEGHSRVHRKGSRGWADDSLTWDHEAPGTVTDVVMGKHGPTVLVKAVFPTQTGDKLCYTPDTYVLTSRGWKCITRVTLTDEIASLRPDGTIEYIRPQAIQAFHHHGRMYVIDTNQVSLCVTENHSLYVQPRSAKANEPYRLVPAADLFGKRYRMKSDGRWQGKDPDCVELPSLRVKAGQFGRGFRTLPAIRMPVRTYMMLLGMYLSEGSIVDQPKHGDFGIDICQTKPESRKRMLAAIKAAGLSYSCTGDKIRIYGKQLMRHFRRFGHSHEKYIPAEVFNWSKASLQTLYRWLMRGDSSSTGTGHSYCTVSRKLAGDFQRLCLHIGYAGRVKETPAKFGKIKGQRYWFRKRYDVRILRSRTHPTVNHGHVKKQGGQNERWVPYDGTVHCVTLPRNHVLYVRRNGYAVWCGNSGRYGDKSVIADIIPQAQMPHDANGRPFEVLANPVGITSRTNPSQVLEAVLGKVAEKRGEPYKLTDFARPGQMMNFAIDELRKHGVPLRESVIDPTTGRKISGEDGQGVLVGVRHIMKLHHLAESKGQSRGTGSYTQMGEPARGTEGNSSKRLALMDTNALISHGAYGVLRDAHLLRGQRNEDYWMQFLQGHTPHDPAVPMVYQKFIHELKASGINVVPDGPRTHVMALTNSDIDQLAGDREVQHGQTVHWNKGLKPVAGGLFDEAVTGGHGSTRWSKISLHEPLPSPVMEDPIRRLLGVTEKEFRDVLAGTSPLHNHGTGPEAIRKALADINVDKAIETARAEFKGGRASIRDQASRKLGYLKSAKALGIHPREWMLDKVPVLPPAFRPVSMMSNDMPLVADANYLYKDLIEARDSLAEMKKHVSEVGPERLALYDSLKAVTGLGDPVSPKLQEKHVQGILKSVFGSSPKYSLVQRRLLSSAVDMVGRATVTPNPDLDMDHVGLPEPRAWELYKMFIARRLKRRGLPVAEAVRNVREQTPLAREALLQELAERPVYIDRAPVLHKFGVLAFWPKLSKTHTLQVNPMICKGFNLDYDGDAMNYHVPVGKEAVQEAVDRMLPSKNLLSPADFKTPMHSFEEDYQGGLFAATRPPKSGKRPAHFRNKQDAVNAFLHGEIGVNDPVIIG